MKETRILLVDFGASGSLGSELCGILESVPHWTVKVERPSPNEPAPFPFNHNLANNLSIVFFVLPASLLKQGHQLFQHIREAAEPPPPLIVVPEAGDPDDLLSLLEHGVSDFITPPLTPLDTLTRVRRLLSHSNQQRTPIGRLKEQLGSRKLIGESKVFRDVVKSIPLIARCDATVLISGETGTGKELCARAIHYLSPRAHQAFVPVNCGAIPAELVENELFGHERGAFTTAVRAQIGLVGEAAGGTLFLDEIDCLPLLSQVKLLRFLQEREYRPLGAAKTHRADVRVITAATVDLDAAVESGRFRQDLYYRLNVIPLRLPPLRERCGDIPVLAEHFLNRYAAEFNKSALSFSAKALELLSHYEWPGNVRELEHLVERTVALSECKVIEIDDLNLPRRTTAPRPTSFREAKAQFERNYVEDLLLANHGNITKAAQAAHKNRRAFWELIRKHHIDVQDFRVDAKSRSTE
ncbi:MAG TPA: sigma-54 dependent transcriptional regulator [Blastocatellia bacterium]|nr:sigma-54 dependent transcriptional regulator [Blastocatellia bacterium]